MPGPSPIASPTSYSSIFVFLSSGEETKVEKEYIHDLIVKHINPEFRDFQHVVHVFDSIQHTFGVPQTTLVSSYLDKLKESHICLVLLGTGWVGLGTYQELQAAVTETKTKGEKEYATVVFKKIGEAVPRKKPQNIPDGKIHIKDVLTFCKNRLVWHNYDFSNPQSVDYYQSALANHTWKIILRR